MGREACCANVGARDVDLDVGGISMLERLQPCTE
jgi:hypothetical protein